MVRSLDLATGDRGFNSSRCTVECDCHQAVEFGTDVSLAVNRHIVRLVPDSRP